jgi:3-keto-L-gulonate-6-phosphate decarboxylase
MSLFGNIMNKIFHHSSARQPETADAGAAQAAPAQPQATAQPDTSAATQSVDVGAVLSEMAASKGGGGNYKSSIVDLLKLLDLDSSLQARKDLANELNVHSGADGSAVENIALHKAVMDKLAANGGIVPDDMRH